MVYKAKPRAKDGVDIESAQSAKASFEQSKAEAIANGRERKSDLQTEAHMFLSEKPNQVEARQLLSDGKTFVLHELLEMYCDEKTTPSDKESLRKWLTFKLEPEQKSVLQSALEYDDHAHFIVSAMWDSGTDLLKDPKVKLALLKNSSTAAGDADV